MAITAAMVKELREATGAGMMDVKKALTEPSTASTSSKKAAPSTASPSSSPHKRRHRAVEIGAHSPPSGTT